MYITSWPQNYSLPPIRVRHIVAGSDLYTGSRGRIGIEGYQKNYSDYPVSTEYPTISLANTVDTLGAQFLWIPLTSQGTGVSRGVELFGETRLGSHIVGQANVAYARAEFAALDGVLRPGNFDYPIVAIGRPNTMRPAGVTNIRPGGLILRFSMTHHSLRTVPSTTSCK